MALSPEQSLNLVNFTEFVALTTEYLNRFIYLVLFDPTDSRVSSFTFTNDELSVITDMWLDKLPLIKSKLVQAIQFTAVDVVDTSGEAIRLLRSGATGTFGVVFNIFAQEIVKITVVLIPPTP